MSDGIRLAPCPNCNASGWIADGNGDWVRCYECNPPAALKPKEGVIGHKATVLTFARGARVRKPAPVDNDLPPTA